MRLFERFSRLVKADAHGVIDSLEERSLLLKQHLREAELALARRRAERDALEEEKTQLGQEAARLRARVAQLDEDVELALSAGKDELARFAVRELLPARRAQDAIEERMARTGERAAEIAAELPEQERELEALRSRVRVQLAANSVPQRAEVLVRPSVADEEVEIELLRRRETLVRGEA